MLGRRARGRVEKEVFPVGYYRLDASDHDAPDGTLREVSNLQPSGPSNSPYWTPAMPWTAIVPTADFTGTICAIGKQTRDRIGDFATYTAAGLERYIVVTTSNVYIYDQEYERITSVYTFADDEATRKCLFASVGPMTVLAVTVNDAPSELLQLWDDACFDYNIPALPVVSAYKAADTTDTDALEAGIYAYRYAYELVDGSISGVSRPYIIDVRTAASRVSLAFAVSDASLDANWTKLIRRVVIYMTQAAATVDASDLNYHDVLMEGPFYEITSITNIVNGSTVTWAKDNDEIVSDVSVDDSNLLQHDLKAAAIFGYNQRLVFGDCEYDFAAPINGAAYALSSAAPPIISVSDPAVIGVGGVVYVQITDPDVDDIEYITVVDDAGFTYQVQEFTSPNWNNVGAADTDYDDTGGGDNYTKMRVAITEVSAGAGTYQFIVTAKDSGGNESSRTFDIVVV